MCQIPARMMRPGTCLASHVLYSFRSCGTPVAGNILIDPSVKFKAVEADALLADRDFGEVRAHFGVEAVAVHAEIAWCVAETQDSVSHVFAPLSVDFA